ncbi:MAG: hypothetical protein R3C11_12530 [Planctomycetaceae bacterium]
MALPGNYLSWLNLVHVDDAARAVLAVEGQTQPAPLYLIADDLSPTRKEYYTRLAKLVEAPPPHFDEDAPAERTQGMNKRCRNNFLKESLDFQFLYPDYITGLKDAVERSEGLS